MVCTLSALILSYILHHEYYPNYWYKHSNLPVVKSIITIQAEYMSSGGLIDPGPIVDEKEKQQVRVRKVFCNHWWAKLSLLNA